MPYSKREYCVRLNTYKYRENIIDWTAVYIFTDDTGVVRMARDHDIIDVLMKDSSKERLQVKNHLMELLPLYEVNELSNDDNMQQPKDMSLIQL